MSKDELDLEKEIQAKGLNAARLTPDYIDSCIKKEAYYVFPGTTVTVCCLTLHNDYNVVAESACASLENFNEEIGRKASRAKAREKIWDLEGYLLRDNLFYEEANKQYINDINEINGKENG